MTSPIGIRITHPTLLRTQLNETVTVQAIESRIDLELDDGSETINTQMTLADARALARWIMSHVDLAETWGR